MQTADLPLNILDAIDIWRLEQHPTLPRDDALTAILIDWLVAHGYLPFVEPEEEL